MELRLKGYGTIEITNATLVDGGDILIETADNFYEIAKTTDYEVAKATLVNVYTEWGLVIRLNVDEDDFDEESVIIFEIENQDAVYELKALL